MTCPAAEGTAARQDRWRRRACPVQWGEAHGGIDASAVAHSAKAGSVAQMRRYGTHAGQVRRGLGQAVGDEFKESP